MLIETYQTKYNCRLIVMVDQIFPDNLLLLEDLLYNADPEQDLHLLLESPGGDGETAIRLIRSLQARCKRLTVIVANQAKSAATLVAIGAHEIVMGPTSDLGPIDPQFRMGNRGLVAAKDITAAVEAALADVALRPDTYVLHAPLLADLTGVMVQQARTAIARSADLLEEALSSNPDRGEDDVRAMKASLAAPLIDHPKSHAMPIDCRAARDYGLPVAEADPRSEQWQLIWRLFMKYRVLGDVMIYEGERVSHVMNIQSGN